jgi:hypothetical protein
MFSAFRIFVRKLSTPTFRRNEEVLAYLGKVPIESKWVTEMALKLRSASCSELVGRRDELMSLLKDEERVCTMVRRFPQVLKHSTSTLSIFRDCLKDFNYSADEILEVIFSVPEIIGASKSVKEPRRLYDIREALQVNDVNFWIIVRRFPNITCRNTATLLQKLEELPAVLNISLESIRAMIVRHPRFLSYSPELILQKAECLGTCTGLSPDNLFKAMMVHSSLWSISVSTVLQRKAFIMEHMKLDEPRVQRLIRSCLPILTLNTSMLTEKVCVRMNALR